MSFKLTQRVIDTPDIPVMQKAVLIVLARHANDDGTNPLTPSVQTLADKSGMCLRAARAALRALEVEGWIEALNDKSGGRKQTTRYRIVIGKLGPIETRHDVPGNEEETRHDVPPIVCETRHEMPPNGHDFRETRHEMPEKAARDAAEETLYEKERDSSRGTRESHAHAHANGAHALRPSGVVVSIGSQKASRAPLPDDWMLPDDWRLMAMNSGLIDADASALKFAMHYRDLRDRGDPKATKTRKGWDDTWQWWVNGDVKRQNQEQKNGRRYAVSGPGTGRDEAISAGIEAARLACERMGAR